MRHTCCEPRRLAAVRAAGVLNGIEWVEVFQPATDTDPLRQRTLLVRLLAADPGLGPANVTITGGDRVPEVDVDWVAPATALPAGEDPAIVADLRDPDEVVVVRTTDRGDFSTYTLSIVAGAGTTVPPAGWDPLLASVPLSFKVECTADADCRVHDVCPPVEDPVPQIDYLAKDFDTFRRLMLDRMSLLAPDWTERSPADVGVTLVELLAWLGDELSYRQDAVATEAWLQTARRRTSLRRHARLVDFRVDEGANARVWAHVAVDGEGALVPAGTTLLTRVPHLPPTFPVDGPEHREALTFGAETFETMHDLVAHGSLAELDFWTWGDRDCCLPVGSTAATLVGHHPALRAGDVLVLAEVAGPRTGDPDDADPARRVAVRLTHVVSSSDPSGGLFADPPDDDARDVTEITWDDADALPVPLCLSVPDHPGPMARAFGNVVLADHGRTVVDEELGVVPSPVLAISGGRADHCATTTSTPVPVRYRPRLAERPLVHVGPSPDRFVAELPLPADVAAELAGTLLGPALQGWLGGLGFTFAAGTPVLRGGTGAWSVSDGTTVVLLAEAAATATASTTGGDTTWHPRPDLLASSGDAREFVVELEHDREATLRFGDGVHGRRPEPGTGFTATYRVGDPRAGNLGADALAHVATDGTVVTGVTNRVAAGGGRPPQPADAIRRDAPEAFLVQQRAVTVDDWVDTAGDHPQVQRAAATFRWTGSWHTVFVTTDRVGGGPVDTAFEADVRRHLEPFRLAGQDLEVDGPVFAALDVGLHVCVEPEHFRSDVRTAVLDVLSSRRRADGTLGLFHPDRFTFGQSVHLSTIVAAAQAVPGVQSVTVTRFARLREPGTSAVDAGVITLGRLEVARLDADPNFPERGRLVVETGGGT
ncbi:putative baseplate assembly protein [Nitriliruptoria bacterium AS10]|nr:putative baseplate assembly protein [Salsipaludibacter albus]